MVQREVSLFSSLYFPSKARSMSLREKAQTAELLVPPICLETAREDIGCDLLGCTSMLALQPWPTPSEQPQEVRSVEGWASLPLPLLPQLWW